jgi:hypothetical protein
MMGFCVMNDEAVDQADEEDNLSYEVSDEALEAASGNEAMRQTATQFFICSSIWCNELQAHTVLKEDSTGREHDGKSDPRKRAALA